MSINCLPFVDSCPETEQLHTLLPQSGFKEIHRATVADLPMGAIVVLYNIVTFTFETVVIRGLQNGMLFYTRQTGRTHDTWNNTLIGDKDCKDYLYKVIS